MDGLPLTDLQFYALFFMLGAFTVKSLSEMVNWSGRRDIYELWLLLFIGFILHDAILRPYRIRYMLLKWTVISLVFILFLYKDIHYIVRDDKVALLASMSILPFIPMMMVLGIYVALTLSMKKLLRDRFSHSKMIPTMPVLTVALISTLMVSFFFV